jgi:hypothetical protein
MPAGDQGQAYTEAEGSVAEPGTLAASRLAASGFRIINCEASVSKLNATGSA